ncbi:MAG TPA: MogA/MoaB family molybdenum cofactor biosynthesis protein [Caldisericia bacterium]|nr:MogA/MoaB family molybdenum cofactor biosynthesis protein [Caldisericia bacterium]
MKKYLLGILVISDSSFNKTRISTTQDLIIDHLHDLFDISVVKIIPDHPLEIETTLSEWADNLHLDLILSTGGTGASPRDFTPEASMKIFDKEIPGISEYLRIKTIEKTPYACLSRGKSGSRKQTLIINLPGSSKAVKEYLELLQPILGHAIDIIQGKVNRCGG